MPFFNNWAEAQGQGLEPLNADPAPIAGAFDQVNVVNQWYNAVLHENLNQKIIEEKLEMMKKSKGLYSKATIDELTRGRSASQLSDEYQDLTRQVTELKASIHQESVELANVLEEISKQVEVVRDIGSTVRDRITSLQMAATQLEKWRQSLHQPSQVEPVPSPPGGHLPPSEAHQPVEAGLAQVAPGLWQLGQV